MTDFFARLETELRIAAERPPRRLHGWGVAARRGGVAAVAVAVLALVLVTALVILGGGDNQRSATPEPKPAPVGTVIPDGTGTPPRDGDHTVVATGTAPVSGPWQMETYRSSRLTDQKGTELQPAGLRCLDLFLLHPPPNSSSGGGGCGELPKTSDFTRHQQSVPNRRGMAVKEILVFGRAPERADLVEVNSGGNRGRAVHTLEGPRRVRGDFYLIPIPPKWTRHGMVTWIDEDRPNENLDGRSIRLLPP